MPDLIQATGLAKRYGRITALAGLDLAVSEGTVLGVLGPNGAGKTTAVSILATLIAPDAGSARVAGADVVQAPRDVRRKIGLSGQFAAVDEHLTGFENLDMIGRLYHLGRRARAQPRHRAAGAVRSGRRRRPPGQDLLRRDAPPPRSGGRPGGRPARAVPGRTHYRPGPRTAAGSFGG